MPIHPSHHRQRENADPKNADPKHADLIRADQRAQSPRRRPARLAVMLTALMALLATLAVSASTATPAAAAADFVCTVTTSGDNTVLAFSGDAVGTTANLRDQDGWVATVTGRTSFTDVGAVGETYTVKLNSLGETVGCAEPPPPPSSGDFACALEVNGNDALLRFSGDRGISENLRRDGRWAATVTGKSSQVVVGAAASDFEVRVRGNGYTGPRGYAVVPCVEAPCETSEILVLCDGALLGSSADFRDENGIPVSKVTDFRRTEAKIGRNYDIFHDFLAPNEWTRIADNGFPYRTGMQELIDEGRVMFVNWKNPGGPNQWSQIVDGNLDSVINATGQALADFGEPVFMTFYHEPENNIEPLAPNNLNRQLELAADHANAFRHIHDRFDAMGADNVIWVWDVMGFDRFLPYYEGGLYPGDDVVDWVAYNQYNFYQCNPNVQNWKTFAEVMSPFYNWLNEGGANRPGLDKPIMIGEFSTQENRGAPNNDQTKGDWYRSIATDLPTLFPRMKALVMFDTEGRFPNGSVQFCEWSVDSSPDALAGWTEMANDPYLNAWSRD